MRDVVPEDLLPVRGYPLLWTVIGVAVLVAAIAAAAWAWWPARTPRVRAAVPDRRTLAQQYLDRIDTIEAAYRRGELDGRRLHLDLSATLRAFHHELGVTGARAMLPDALRGAGLAASADAITASYAPQFRYDGVADPDAALLAARGAVAAGDPAAAPVMSRAS